MLIFHVNLQTLWRLDTKTRSEDFKEEVRRALKLAVQKIKKNTEMFQNKIKGKRVYIT